MVWTSIQRFSAIGIQFISGIILARLLTPYDYGCIGMLSIFMMLAEAFIDGGFGSALIQKKHPTQDDYSTIFWWNLGMAVLMYAILFVSAPAVAHFYDIPLLCDVLRVQGLVLFIYAFNIVQRNQLKKKLNFKVLSIVTITTSIIALGITIFMAYRGFGVWALVAQNLVTAAIPALVFWFFIKWLIGKVYSPVTLGYFSKAIGTENLASRSISSVMTQVTYPLYAQVQDDKTIMANMVKRLTMTIAFITFPMMAILMLTAKPIFVLLYSDRWLASVPYFQVLCLVGLSECLQAVNTQTIAAIGKSMLMFQWTIIKRSVGMFFMIGGLFWFGMKGLLIGCVIYNWFCYFVNIGLVSKYIGYSWKKQLIDLLPVTIVTILAAIMSFLMGYLCQLSMYYDGLVKLLVFVALYLAWVFLFKPESYRYFLTIIPNRFKFFEKNK